MPLGERQADSLAATTQASLQTPQALPIINPFQHGVDFADGMARISRLIEAALLELSEQGVAFRLDPFCDCRRALPALQRVDDFDRFHDEIHVGEVIGVCAAARLVFEEFRYQAGSLDAVHGVVGMTDRAFFFACRCHPNRSAPVFAQCQKWALSRARKKGALTQPRRSWALSSEHCRMHDRVQLVLRWPSRTRLAPQRVRDV